MISLLLLSATFISAAPFDIPGLPASAVSKSNTLPSDLDALLLAEARRALSEKREFEDIGMDEMKSIPKFKAWIDQGAYCGSLRHVQPLSLSGAVTLLYLQRSTALTLGNRRLQMANAALKALDLTEQRVHSAEERKVIDEAVASQKEAQARVDALSQDIRSLEHLLVRNGWASETETIMVRRDKRLLQVRLTHEKDFLTKFVGRC